MSQIDSIDSASLRARLRWAIGQSMQTADDGSLYLLCLGACFLACSHVREEETLQALYYTQAAVEEIEADDLLSRIILAGGAS